MRKATLLLLPLAALPVLFFSSPSVADSPCPSVLSDCDQIRNVHLLAARDGLDEGSFFSLEKSYCKSSTGYGGSTGSGGYETSAISEDCQDLTLMSRLAVLSGADKSLIATVERRRKGTCTSGGSSSSSDWPGGVTAKYSNGSWNYPNGTTAKYSNDSWNYSSGTTARYSNGSWNYPNGTTAKYSNGSWNAPDGSSIKVEDLLTQSCERVTESDCKAALKIIKGASGEEKVLGIVEFAWGAWSIGGGY